MGRRTWVVVVVAAALLVSGCTGPIGAGGVVRQPIPTPDLGAATSSESPPEADPQTADPGPADEHPADPTGEAAAVLATLPVRERDSGGYNRDLFGQRWSDDVAVAGGHNGCDTRNDILRRDLDSVTAKPGTRECVILTGTLVDPYTGETINFVRGPDSDRVQIDHVVALSDAWSTGARQLTLGRRTELANDPLNLLAVGGPVNQSKGNSDASAWLPPVPDVHCEYVARQIAVKHRYGLWVTPAEGDAMRTALRTCPGQALPLG